MMLFSIARFCVVFEAFKRFRPILHEIHFGPSMTFIIQKILQNIPEDFVAIKDGGDSGARERVTKMCDILHKKYPVLMKNPTKLEAKGQTLVNQRSCLSVTKTTLTLRL